MSIGDFQRSIQVYAIRDYLKNTDMSLKEIATLTGFYDKFSLNKVFKRIEGMPPGEYTERDSKRKELYPALFLNSTIR